MTQKRVARRIERELTPAERRRLATLRKKIDAERSDLVARGRQHKRASEAARALIAELKAARTRQAISLAGIKQRTGMSRESVCALENTEHPNPTLVTLLRYADAVGVRIIAAPDTPSGT